MFERNLSGMASELMLTQSQREQESFRIGQKQNIVTACYRIIIEEVIGTIFDDLLGNEAGGYRVFFFFFRGGEGVMLDSCFLLATSHMLPN